MKRATSLAAALLILVNGYTTTFGADFYWDINGTNAGATDDGGGVANGAVTDSSWNTASDGVSATPGAFTLNNRAVFSAGTNATGASIISGNLGTQSTSGAGTIGLSGMLIEEGQITISGSLAMAPNAVVELMPGTTLTTNTSANVGIAAPNTTTFFSYKLNGTTAALETTNTGNAGSFVSTKATITLNGGGALIYGGPQINILQTDSAISGSGPLVKKGGGTSSGVLAIASTCTYTGATIIDEGEIRIRTTANRLPVATDVTVNANGILNLNSVNQQIASLTGTGQVGLGSATLTIDGSSNTTFDGVVGDTHNAGAGGTTALLGKLVKNGTGVQTLNGVNDLRGSVTLNAGGITIGASGGLCEDVADLIVNGGTLTLNQSEEKVENLSGTGGSIVLNGTALQTNPSDATTSNTTYAGTISGNGSLKKTNYLWDSSAASPLRINLTSIASGDYKTLTLTGNNSYSGGTEIVGGGIRANSATALGTGPVTINTSGKLDGSGQVAGAITVQAGGHLGGGIGTANGTLLTANGAVTLQAGGSIDALLGAGAVALTGDYNSDSVVDAADYVIWRDTNINGAQGYTDWRNNYGSTAAGGIGTSDRVKVTTNSLTLNAGGMVTLLGTGTTAPTGTYSVLDYNTSYTGSLAGLYINNATGMELTGGLVDNTSAHRIEVTVSNTAQVRSWASAGDGNWSANPAEAGNWSAAGQPNGPGATATFGGGSGHTVTITDSDKTLGTMNLNTSGYNIAATGANQLVMNTYSGTPTINVTGNSSITAPLVTAKNTTVNVNNGGDTLTISGLVSNTGGLTKAGAGAVTVDGVVASTGTLTVSGGTLNLTNNNLMSGVITVAAGATLNAANTPGGTGHSATGSGAVNNSGTLNITGRVRGTVTTSGATGVTTVTGGSSAIQSLLNTTNIDTGGTLTGNGWTGGITDKTTGHLNPGGINTVGTINANGTVNFNNGSFFDIDCGGGNCDLLNIANNAAGTLVFPANTTGGVVNFAVKDAGGLTDGIYTIINYNAGTTATATNAAVFGTVVAATGPAGHSYSLAIDTVNKLVNLTISTPGSGNSLNNAAVPEPTTAVLVLLGALGFVSRRRGR